MNLVEALLAAADADSGSVGARGRRRDRDATESSAPGSARAHTLLGEHVSVGDRVAIVADNEPAFVTAYLATLAVGAVAVPLNPLAPAQELARELAVVEPALLVASAEHARPRAKGDGARRWAHPAVGARRGSE